MSWQDIRGHDALVRLFDTAIQRDRLAHAYLFTGPPGVGKRLFATELAKALLCEAAPPGALAACDKCPGCIQVAAGTHPDLFTGGRLEEKADVSIDTIRDLCKSFALKPARGRGKVLILDDADDLNDASANCFLKTLEEPPPRSLLILIGTSPAQQLATIVSRCQVIRFAPLADQVVAELLRKRGIADAGILDRAVRLSGGSPGQGLALADPTLWEFRALAVQTLTQPRADTVALSRKWEEFVNEAGKDSAAQRRRASLTLRLVIDFLADALRVSVGAAPTSREDLLSLQALAGRAGPERLIDALDRCLEGDMHIDRKVQLVLALEALADGVGQKLGAA